jgi:hypothetical protein
MNIIHIIHQCLCRINNNNDNLFIFSVDVYVVLIIIIIIYLYYPSMLIVDVVLLIINYLYYQSMYHIMYISRRRCHIIDRINNNYLLIVSIVDVV